MIKQYFSVVSINCIADKTIFYRPASGHPHCSGSGLHSVVDPKFESFHQVLISAFLSTLQVLNVPVM